jgi:hypothetical protein
VTGQCQSRFKSVTGEMGKLCDDSVQHGSQTASVCVDGNENTDKPVRILMLPAFIDDGMKLFPAGVRRLLFICLLLSDQSEHTVDVFQVFTEPSPPAAHCFRRGCFSGFGREIIDTAVNDTADGVAAVMLERYEIMGKQSDVPAAVRALRLGNHAPAIPLVVGSTDNAGDYLAVSQVFSAIRTDSFIHSCIHIHLVVDGFTTALQDRIRIEVRSNVCYNRHGLSTGVTERWIFCGIALCGLFFSDSKKQALTTIVDRFS